MTHLDTRPTKVGQQYLLANIVLANFSWRVKRAGKVGRQMDNMRISFGQKCIQFKAWFKGSSLWNRLPSSLKIPSSVVF